MCEANQCLMLHTSSTCSSCYAIRYTKPTTKAVRSRTMDAPARRRAQVIEEAPAPGIDPAFRASIGAAAVAAARAVGYRNAGTVEFIVDTDSGDYYFMEMNARLQASRAPA